MADTSPITQRKPQKLVWRSRWQKNLPPDNIRVNSIAPGSILFPGGGWDRRIKADPERMKAFVESEMPLGRFGKPEEIANVAVFLASERASLVTGACINVDGCQSRSNI